MKTRKRIIVHIIMFVLVSCLLTQTSFSAPNDYSQNNFIPFSVFDPNFDYLDNGYAQISDEGSGQLTIYAETEALQYVDVIGVQITLQQWSGTQWVDYYSSPDKTLNNEASIYLSKNTTVPTGYYYRIHSTHWIIENGTKEQGERYTSSTLIN